MTSQTTPPNPNKHILNILAVVIAGITLVFSITIPEVRCFLRLECPPDPHNKYNFKLVVLTEESKALKGVEVVFSPSGDTTPVVERTNSDGYVQVKLPSKGDIEIRLSKDGYETLIRTINLAQEPDRTRTFTLKKVLVNPTPYTDGTNPIIPSTPGAKTLSSCERTRGDIAEDYYEEIVVNRTYKKPDKRIELSTTNPYSEVCKIVNNTGNLSFIHAIPDKSELRKVNISLYLDGKLSKSVDVTRGSLVSLTADTKNISNYSIEYKVEDGEAKSRDYLYMFPTSN